MPTLKNCHNYRHRKSGSIVCMRIGDAEVPQSTFDMYEDITDSNRLNSSRALSKSERGRLSGVDPKDGVQKPKIRKKRIPQINPNQESLF